MGKWVTGQGAMGLDQILHKRPTLLIQVQKRESCGKKWGSLFLQHILFHCIRKLQKHRVGMCFQSTRTIPVSCHGEVEALLHMRAEKLTRMAGTLIQAKQLQCQSHGIFMHLETFHLFSLTAGLPCSTGVRADVNHLLVFLCCHEKPS